MNNRVVIIAVVLLVLLGAGAYLLTKNSSTTLPAATPTPTVVMKETVTPTATVSPTTRESGTPVPSGSADVITGKVKEFVVTGSNFKFSPNTLAVKKGDTVKITFTSAGGYHDFTLDAFNVKTNVIPSGQSETVQFVANKAGTFEYYCSVANHRAMGMKGTLTVE